jgi:hypothetical protein
VNERLHAHDHGQMSEDTNWTQCRVGAAYLAMRVTRVARHDKRVHRSVLLRRWARARIIPRCPRRTMCDARTRIAHPTMGRHHITEATEIAHPHDSASAMS